MKNLSSDDVLNKLLHRKSISDKSPWSSNNEEDIDHFYKTICENLCREFSLSSQIEWSHYGLGYASYIDAWFYRDNDKFEKSSKPEHNEYTGLVILFSRLSPYFVAGEASKSWNAKGAAGYLPSLGLVDYFISQAVTDLLKEIEPYIIKHGLIRLHPDDLKQELPQNRRVPTILCDPPFHAFDALFRWED